MNTDYFFLLVSFQMEAAAVEEATAEEEEEEEEVFMIRFILMLEGHGLLGRYRFIISFVGYLI